jgi:hypothetical protein
VAGLERVVRGDERPRKPELRRRRRRQGAHAVRLGGVMAAEIQVEPLLLGDVVPLLAQFPGDKRVNAGAHELGHGAVAAAAAKGDAGGTQGAALDGGEARVELPKARPQVVPAVGERRRPADRLAFADEERQRGVKSELPGEERVVPQGGVPVERQVIRVKRAVSPDKRGQARVGRAGERSGPSATARVNGPAPASTAAPMRVMRPELATWRPLKAPGASV